MEQGREVDYIGKGGKKRGNVMEVGGCGKGGDIRTVSVYCELFTGAIWGNSKESLFRVLRV